MIPSLSYSISTPSAKAVGITFKTYTESTTLYLLLYYPGPSPTISTLDQSMASEIVFWPCPVLLQFILNLAIKLSVSNLSENHQIYWVNLIWIPMKTHQMWNKQINVCLRQSVRFYYKLVIIWYQGITVTFDTGEIMALGFYKKMSFL